MDFFAGGFGIIFIDDAGEETWIVWRWFEVRVFEDVGEHGVPVARAVL